MTSFLCREGVFLHLVPVDGATGQAADRREAGYQGGEGPSALCHDAGEAGPSQSPHTCLAAPFTRTWAPG